MMKRKIEATVKGLRLLLLTLLLLQTLPALAQQAQTKRLKGQVVDATSGETLVGVTVMVQGNSQNVTVTDKNGNFTITASESDVLVLNYIGYTAQQLPVKDFNGVVKIAPSTIGLKEVTVIGYGTVDKGDFTGSLSEVKMEDLNKAPVASFDQALAGRVAGVQVTSNDDQPGSEMNIVIRGGNSLTQSNSPLYVIDGFPIEDFTSAALNPSDIATISVLKDASATAIYGSRGANGVVIIETKKGKTGKPVLNYESYYGFQQVTKTMDLLSPYEFVKYQLERDESNMTQLYLTTPGLTLEDYRNVNAIDWQDQMFQTAPIQSHNLSLSGGSAQTRYTVSGSVFDQDGININSGYRRYQGRVSLDQTINKDIKVGLNANYSRDKNFGQFSSVAQSSSNAYSTYTMYQVWGYRPVITTGEDFNIFEDLFDPEANDNRINPIVSIKNELRERHRSNLITNGYLTYNLLDDLELKIRGGINSRTIRDDAFYNSKTRRGFASSGNTRGVNGSVTYHELNDWMNENTLTYKKRLSNKSQFDATVGYTMQGTSSVLHGYESQQIPNEELGISGMDQGLPSAIRALQSNNTLVSYLGRVNYNYKSKYFFTLSSRADGSSKFSPENRWGYFPSGAFAWRMNREDFMKDLNFVSDAKLRISYGVTGNNRVGDFIRFSSLSSSAYYSFNNQTPSLITAPSNLGNPDLKWEKTTQVDIGYDLSLFKNRVNLIVDLYRKTTSDLLLNANVPTSTGFSNIFKNVGKVQNQGLEVSLNTVNLQSGAFRWETDFNIAFNNNKVLSLAEGEDNIRSSISWTGDYNNAFLYLAKVGGPAAAFYGYVWDGVYQFEDFDTHPGGHYTLKSDVPTNGAARENIKPGDIKYRDQNGDGVVNDQDKVIIGRALPLHTGGFNNNFNYKGFSLNVFFQWSYGNDIFNANRIIFEGNATNRSSLNQFAGYADRWTPENPSNTYYRVGGQGPNGVYSSRTIEDGSFLRLKTVSLSYAIPKPVLDRVKLKNLEVFVSAQNLYTWTNYSGMDPEVSVRNTTLTPGFDYSAYPRSRTVTTGLRVRL